MEWVSFSEEVSLVGLWREEVGEILEDRASSASSEVGGITPRASSWSGGFLRC